MNQEYIAGGDISRVNVANKRILNAEADVNQLVPFKHKWAWQQYLSATEQQWMPAEIDMTQDVENLDRFHPTIKLLLVPVIRELKAANNLMRDVAGVGIYRITTSPECRQFLLAANFGSTIRDIALSKIEDDLRLDLNGAPVSNFHALTEELTRNICDVTFTTDTRGKEITFITELVIQLVRRHVFLGHKQLYQLWTSDLTHCLPGTFELLQRIVTRDLQIADFYCNMIVSAMNELSLAPVDLQYIKETTAHQILAAEKEQGHAGPTVLGNLFLQKLGFATRPGAKDLPQAVKELYGLVSVQAGHQAAASVVQQESTGLEWD